MAITLNGSSGISSPGGDTSTSLSTGLLTVTGSTAPTNGLYLPTTNTVALATNSTERMRLDASGNLGLGVTPSAWGSSAKAFETPGGALFALSTTDLYLSRNAYYNGTNWIYKTTNSASVYSQAAGIHAWSLAASGTAGNAISFTQAMTLDASGNLGIGTTSPSSKLTLGAGGVATFYRSDNTRYGSVYTDNNGFNVVANSAGDFLYLTSAAASSGIILSTVNTERARIDSSGKVLVGTTSAKAQLTVNAGITFNPYVSAQYTGLNVTEYYTYNDGSANAFSTACANAAGNIIISSNAGLTVIPFWPNGGAGVAFVYTMLDPDAGTFAKVNSVSFVQAGSSGNTFTVTISSGAGVITVQRTAGALAYNMALQLFVTNI